MPTLPAGDYQPASLSHMDAGGERTSFHIWGKKITAANHDVQVGLWADVVTACEDLVLGVKVRENYGLDTKFTAARPSNGAAREVALQVIGQDAANGQIYRANLGTLDISLIDYVSNVGAIDAVDPTTTEVAALKTALDLFSVNPMIPANLLTVIGFKVVRGLK